MQPNYKVQVGEFVERLEAQKIFSMLKKEFPSCPYYSRTHQHQSVIYELSRKIKALAEKHEQDVIANRQHLHANPELSFEEHNTAAYVTATAQSTTVFLSKRRSRNRYCSTY